MVHISAFVLALAGLSSLVRAQYGYGGGSGYDDPAPSSTPEPPPVASSDQPSSDPPASVAASTAVGDVQCGTVMCIGASVEGDNVQYVMQSIGNQQPGWMAMGFGRTMIRSPLVIMWGNADGSFTLSQREATDRVLPTVVPNPERLATVSDELSVAGTRQPKFAFTIPMGPNMKPDVIWAFGEDRPTSADPNTATFREHLTTGRFSFDLTKANANMTILESPALSLLPGGSAGRGSNNNRGGSKQKTSAEMIALAHGIVCAIVFLVILPAGALLARYVRTFSTSWFKGHWILQFVISAPMVLAGLILGAIVARIDGVRTWNTHTQVGVLLISLYCVQLLLGAIIHFFKPKNANGRPLQNYGHAILGISIIGLAFFQVRTGYKYQWVSVTGKPAHPAINGLWYLWVVVIPLAYFGGLAFLRKQYRQEQAAREAPKLQPWQERKYGA